MSIKSITRKDIRHCIFLIIFGVVIGLISALGFSLLYFFPRYHLESQEIIVNESTLFILLFICFIRMAIINIKTVTYESKKGGIFIKTKIPLAPISFGLSVGMSILFLMFLIFNSINKPF